MSSLPSSSDSTPDIAGRMAGEYRLGRKLGEGGYGAVYEAEHPVLRRRAAVKVLHQAAGVDSDTREVGAHDRLDLGPERGRERGAPAPSPIDRPLVGGVDVASSGTDLLVVVIVFPMPGVAADGANDRSLT